MEGNVFNKAVSRSLKKVNRVAQNYCDRLVAYTVIYTGYHLTVFPDMLLTVLWAWFSIVCGDLSSVEAVKVNDIPDVFCMNHSLKLCRDTGTIILYGPSGLEHWPHSLTQR